MSKAPQISDLATLSDQRKTDLDKEFGRLVTRLITRDCLKEVRPLVADDTKMGFSRVGGALGRIAMQELFGNPQAERSLTAYTEYLSEADFKPIMDVVEKSRAK